MELKRVVVTGIGTINPLGNNLAETWESFKNGVSGSDKITRFDASKFKTQFACEVKTTIPTRISIGKRDGNWICMPSLP